MKTQYWIILLFLLASVNAAWIWRSASDRRSFTGRVDRIREEYSGVERENHLLKRGWNFATRSDGIRLPDRLIIRMEDHPPVTLGEVIGERERLLIVISWRHCSSCIDELLFTLKLAIPESERNRVDVLYSCELNNGGEWDYRRKILPGVRFLNIQDAGLNLPADSLDVPYLTVVNRDLKTRHTFVHYPSLTRQTESYLRLIGDKYLNN